ncbi:hypothetical protein B0H19DRAFT_1264749 [Mycena capillaripes]|nr:hypothetical protein B0H19DRAFT_1264749 [Mycena capillaripes]
MALILMNTVNRDVDPCVGQSAEADTADGSTTNTTDNSNQPVAFRGRFFSSMWDIIRSPVGAIQWGSTMDNMLGRLGRAAHESWGDRAHQAGRGPHAVADNIISLFGEGRDRVGNLAAVQRELKLPKEKRHTTEEQDEKEVETTKRIDPSALQKQCSRFMKYTLSEETVDMQCVAFQRLVQLTTMFPGLRLMLLLSKHIQSSEPAKVEDKISRLWDRSQSSFLSDDEAEWRFWRSFAEMCLSKAPITLTIEECQIPQVVQYELGTSKCVVGKLLLAHGSCDAATEISSALSIRCLGQIIALVEFWDQVKVPDPGHVDSPPMAPHTTVQKLCVLLRHTLQDLEPQGTKPPPFDYEGVDFLASRFLDGVIEVLQVVSDVKNNLIGCWYRHCCLVVRLLRHEWCKEYLPDSYHLAHGEFLKARMPEEPATDVTESVPTEAEVPAAANVEDTDPVPTETQTPAAADVDVNDPVATETQGPAAANIDDEAPVPAEMQTYAAVI